MSASTIVWFYSDDPAASYDEPVRALMSVWALHVPAEVARRVAHAIAPDADGRSPLRDGAVISIDLPASAIAPSAPGAVRIDIACRAIVRHPATPDGTPVVIGRAMEVTAHPVPTDSELDLSAAVTLTALALAAGAAEVSRRDWAWALQIPGTSWVIGRPDAPGVAYGLGACEERRPSRGVTAWREAQRQRLEAARMALAEYGSEDGHSGREAS